MSVEVPTTWISTAFQVTYLQHQRFKAQAAWVPMLEIGCLLLLLKLSPGSSHSSAAIFLWLRLVGTRSASFLVVPCLDPDPCGPLRPPRPFWVGVPAAYRVTLIPWVRAVRIWVRFTSLEVMGRGPGWRVAAKFVNLYNWFSHLGWHLEQFNKLSQISLSLKCPF